MAAPMAHDGYESWLEKRLLSANPDADTDVLVSYITGLLEEDCPEEEKRESLVDLLAQVVEESADQEQLCDELLKHWNDVVGDTNSGTQTKEDVQSTDRLAQLLEEQKIETVKPKERSEEEKARKAAILATYSAMSDDEENEATGEATGNGQGDDLLDLKNTNTEAVRKLAQEQREQAKLESDRKKEKDKQDREAQKQKQKERKETEKKRTQKGERRR